MSWEMGLRAWFVVAMACLGLALFLSSSLSMLPGVWRAINIALVGAVAVSAIADLGAQGAVLATAVLVLAVLAGSFGLWLGIARRDVDRGRAVLVIGGTLCVLFAALRMLAWSARASSDFSGLAGLLGEAVLMPLLIVLGALALGVGSRRPNARTGTSGLVSSLLYFVGVCLLMLAANEAVVGQSGTKALALGCVAVVLLAPGLVVLGRTQRHEVSG